MGDSRPLSHIQMTSPGYRGKNLFKWFRSTCQDGHHPHIGHLYHVYMITVVPQGSNTEPSWSSCFF